LAKDRSRRDAGRRVLVQTLESGDFRELAVRLAGWGVRVFAEFGLGGADRTVAGVGLSVEDFVSLVLSEYVEGKLQYEASRGTLFSLLSRALRNDVIDALRKAPHAREEARARTASERDSEVDPPSLDEFPATATDIHDSLDEARYRYACGRPLDEPELAEVLRAVLDLNLSKPQDIAEALGISTTECQNRKMRLRRRLVEYNLVIVRNR
jgi:DNA-directed RNA polymerase specialized sigma24 family protein